MMVSLKDAIKRRKYVGPLALLMISSCQGHQGTLSVVLSKDARREQKNPATGSISI